MNSTHHPNRVTTRAATTFFTMLFAPLVLCLSVAAQTAADRSPGEIREPGTHATDTVKADTASGSTLLPVQEYEDKVHASLLGQLVGNLYGLGYEFKFIDEPGPETMPYGYTEGVLQRVDEMNGGFSDDDTDIEYMYLLQMERHGIEPTYGQLAEAWKQHVRERVWVANRVALTLMHTGLYPPHTGRKQ